MTTVAAFAPLVIAAALAEALHVPQRGTVRIEVPGAIAAYAVDAAIAEVSAANGVVMVRGRYAGTTHLTIVGADGEVASRLVVVDRPPSSLAVPPRTRGPIHGALETQYDSSSGRLATAVEHTRMDGDRSLRLELLNLSRVTGSPAEDAVSTMARASLELRGSGWRATLLDARVDHSPLSVEGTTLRGGHVSAGPLELHAGYTSPLWYRGFLLPGDRETAAGASYRLSLGSAGSVAPVVYGFGGAAREPGAMGSLLFERATPGAPVHIRAEAGWGGKPGGALRLSLGGTAARIQLDGRHVPAGFASLRTGRIPGSSGEALSTLRLSRSVELLASASASLQELPVLTQRRESASAEARWQLARAWSATAGLTRSRTRADTAAVDTLTAPLGLAWRGRSTSLSGQYRYRRNSLLDEGGHGGRLQASTRVGRFAAGGYVDGQQADATLELLFRESPDLARLFTELGLEARTPQELEQLLREQPALADQLAGASIALHPWRVVAGGDLSWTSRDASRQELRMSFLVERTRTTRRVEEGGSGTLRYGRRLVGSLDVFGAASAWSRVLGGTEQRGWSWSAGLRHRFDGSPRMSWSRRSVVEGRVLQDPMGLGRPGAEGAPEPGVRVRLDDGRDVLTDAAGRFRFQVKGAGHHRIEVVLPGTAGAYFTTPSVVTATAGDRIEFGISRTPARLTGTLRDDSGAGIAGATVNISGPATLSSTTDSSGRFSFAGPEGAYTLAIDAASLPPGHDLSRIEARPVRLARDMPAREDFVVRAFRSISGTVRGPPLPGRWVWLVEPYVRREVGSDGRYVFRDLAPGRYTIAVHMGDQFERRVVDVPTGPATIRDVDFGPLPR